MKSIFKIIIAVVIFGGNSLMAQSFYSNKQRFFETSLKTGKINANIVYQNIGFDIKDGKIYTRLHDGSQFIDQLEFLGEEIIDGLASKKFKLKNGGYLYYNKNTFFLNLHPTHMLDITYYLVKNNRITSN